MPFTDSVTGRAARGLFDTGGMGAFVAMGQLITSQKLERAPDAGSVQIGFSAQIGFFDGASRRSSVRFVRLDQTRVGSVVVDTPRVLLAPQQLDGATYRVAVGPRAGQKVFALQTVPARETEPRPGVARYAGFSLHAGIGVEAGQRGKLERLARYFSRPAVAVECMALTAQVQVRYRLKTPYRDGTTHIVLEPVDFMARLAALVPPPRVHLARFHGVFAPHAALRAARTAAAFMRSGSASGRAAIG